jgi:hypothetical protein
VTLQEAIKQGKQLAVAVARDHERQAAEIYVLPTGVAFLDIGWSEPAASSFRAHYMPGQVTGDGPWSVGGWTVREIDPETDPEYVEEWDRWQRHQAETDATRDKGATYAREILELEVLP